MIVRDKIKRIYRDFLSGYGIPISRRSFLGVSEDNAKVDLWLGEILPSSDHGKWFSHDSKKWGEIKSWCTKELKPNLGYCNLKVWERRKVTLLLSATQGNRNAIMMWR